MTPSSSLRVTDSDGNIININVDATKRQKTNIINECIEPSYLRGKNIPEKWLRRDDRILLNWSLKQLN